MNFLSVSLYFTDSCEIRRRIFTSHYCVSFYFHYLICYWPNAPQLTSNYKTKMIECKGGLLKGESFSLLRYVCFKFSANQPMEMIDRRMEFSQKNFIVQIEKQISVKRVSKIEFQLKNFNWYSFRNFDWKSFFNRYQFQSLFSLKNANFRSYSCRKLQILEP